MGDNKFRIAIIGGGLAGATLANALFRIPYLDAHVYESSATFSERGAAVGLSANAQQALEMIIVPSSKELLERAGAVPMNSSRAVLGSGPEAGTIIIDLAGHGDPGVVVHRAALLRELLAPLPPDLLHANKKLNSLVQEEDGLYQVRFEDGTVERFDAVIGADGIFGSVRSFVLGDAAAAAAAEHGPSPAGFWDCRVLVPFDKAKATLGEQYFDVHRQYGWVGDGAFIMHDILDAGTTVQCVVSAVEKDAPRDRKRPLTLESLTKSLRTWLDGPIAKGVIDVSFSLVLDQADPQGYSQWEHKSTPTYANGRVCIIGDAAHATSPWQGAGAGQAFEDALILGFLLGNDHVKRRADIEAAFKAFDVVRRPRCQQVIDSSRGTGAIMCGQNPDVGLDPARVRAAFAGRWSFIFSLDLDEYRQDALKKMREFLGQ
ncbi:hypothetical protein B0T26DRAFT_645322 [Lasiosphaeria miniovina]|uniref:FAD-binding domain-containing protein n=1 Tax=Lasiosphaeria miniovina TaxID=1954250 RepID=A0AA40AJA6_9PEZI|nr:uncharacterized protein B0T26DRAFT_645322 [Lasiosphaeria miniovina]KAK0716926.1 hypothetical protein B0T26DRAFT_645322 [Lasiosphaeria miniovina]